MIQNEVNINSKDPGKLKISFLFIQIYQKSSYLTITTVRNMWPRYRWSNDKFTIQKSVSLHKIFEIFVANVFIVVFGIGPERLSDFDLQVLESVSGACTNLLNPTKIYFPKIFACLTDTHFRVTNNWSECFES